MEVVKGNSVLDVFFELDTMSAHFKAWNRIFKKNWKPGEWKSIHEEKIVNHKELSELIDHIYQEIASRDDAFLEIDKPLSKVIQLGPYRIVIVYPPLSDGLEMTVVKPTMRLTLADYKLDEDIVKMLKYDSKWVLICWSPWSWKTTFVQAVADMYVEMDKVVKTLESPRDLMLSNDVVQYSFSYWTHNELRDILLLSRPDFTLYDEVRNQEDFLLFKDLRLTGIGLVGAMHATKAVDSIQRFLWAIDLWIIPQVVDTIIYIKDWAIWEILQLSLVVKVPSWMHSEDLSRPVVEIRNFMTSDLEYEIYSYGEQIVVIPISAIEAANGGTWSKAQELAWRYLQDYFNAELWFWSLVHVSWDNWINIYLPHSKKWQFIGKGWEKVTAMEKKLWVSIQVKTFDDLVLLDFKPPFEVWKNKAFLTVMMPSEFAKQKVSLFVDNKVITSLCDDKWTFTITKKELIRDIQSNWLRIIDRKKL